MVIDAMDGKPKGAFKQLSPADLPDNEVLVGDRVFRP